MSARFIIGDAHEVLATMPDNSVDLVISSPPFLALRSYLPADHIDKHREIGSEATPAAFLDVLLDIVEECARVLAPHGSLCFELGDTYSGSGGAGGDYNEDGLREGQQVFSGSAQKRARLGVGDDYRPARHGRGVAAWPDAKSLCLIPQSFAWALSYGRNPFNGRETPRWKVRNIVRWCRPNPPVGALGDKFRPATSEMVVACKAQNRWFDLDGVRRPGRPENWEHSQRYSGNGYDATKNGNEKRADSGAPRFADHPAGAPPLDWWEIPTQPYKGSHYATWPEKLLVKPVLSMCPERVCKSCGEPSRRITQPSEKYESERCGTDFFGKGNNERTVGLQGERLNGRPNAEYETVGWTDCGHNDYRRGIVLDCFGGSGTTAAVAEGHGRDSILIDIDARNAQLASERVGMFLTVEQAVEPKAG